MTRHTKNQEKYLLQATEVFKNQGFKISLDDLALQMGISKKTLYNQFSSKDELLEMCVCKLRTDLEENLGIMYDDRVDAIEGLRRGFGVLTQFFYTLSSRFFTDLQVTHPELANNEHLLGSHLFTRAIQLNLEKGIREGLYLESLDVRLISHYFAYSIISFFITSIVHKQEFPVESYFSTIIAYNLRGLVSSKGQLHLNT